MKFATLSIAAIMAMGISAFADVQNLKVNGSAKLFYATADGGNADLFSQEGSAGQAAANVVISGELADGVKGQVGFSGLSTLGLENNLVSAIWAGFDNHASEGNVLDTQYWMNEAWIAKTFGKTTLKIGRQELDTPLAFSEKWNIAANTFDAAVILNQDIPETTLVAAWVGRGNGAGGGSVVQNASGGDDPYRTYGSAIDDTLSGILGKDSQLASGAYALAAVTTAIPMTTAQVWYYNVVDIAQAFWLQADVNAEGVTIGLQYANINPDAKVDHAVGVAIDDSMAWALKIGYDISGLKVAVAYSSTDEDGVVDVANTATGLRNSQSKLYTEAWWSYGYVGKPDTDAFALSAEYEAEEIANFGVYYTSTSNDSSKVDMSELTLTASKDFGALNTTLAYIYTDADDLNQGDSFNTLQAYITYSF